MAPSNYINYHRLAHNYTKRPSRPRLRRTGYWPADARGYVWCYTHEDTLRVST